MSTLQNIIAGWLHNISLKYNWNRIKNTKNFKDIHKGRLIIYYLWKEIIIDSIILKFLISKFSIILLILTYSRNFVNYFIPCKDQQLLCTYLLIKYLSLISAERTIFHPSLLLAFNTSILKRYLIKLSSIYLKKNIIRE